MTKLVETSIQNTQNLQHIGDYINQFTRRRMMEDAVIKKMVTLCQELQTVENSQPIDFVRLSSVAAIAQAVQPSLPNQQDLYTPSTFHDTLFSRSESPVLLGFSRDTSSSPTKFPSAQSTPIPQSTIQQPKPCQSSTYPKKPQPTAPSSYSSSKETGKPTKDQHTSKQSRTMTSYHKVIPRQKPGPKSSKRAHFPLLNPLKSIRDEEEVTWVPRRILKSNNKFAPKDTPEEDIYIRHYRYPKVRKTKKLRSQKALRVKKEFI